MFYYFLLDQALYLSLKKDSGLTKHFSQREDADLPDTFQNSLGFNWKADHVNPLLLLVPLSTVFAL